MLNVKEIKTGGHIIAAASAVMRACVDEANVAARLGFIKRANKMIEAARLFAGSAAAEDPMVCIELSKRGKLVYQIAHTMRE